jgi:hypothetical protein
MAMTMATMPQPLPPDDMEDEAYEGAEQRYEWGAVASFVVVCFLLDVNNTVCFTSVDNLRKVQFE